MANHTRFAAPMRILNELKLIKNIVIVQPDIYDAILNINGKYSVFSYYSKYIMQCTYKNLYYFTNYKHFVFI